MSEAAKNTPPGNTSSMIPAIPGPGTCPPFLTARNVEFPEILAFFGMYVFVKLSHAGVFRIAEASRLKILLYQRCCLNRIGSKISQNQGLPHFFEYEG